MKKILTVLSVLLLSLCMHLPVRADVIFEPYDDFFEAHRDECESTLIGRRYTPAGEKGTEVFASPESDSVVETLPFDAIFWSNTTYTNSAGSWYYFQGRAIDQTGKVIMEGAPDGWVKASEVSRLYDSEQFSEDYKDQIIGHSTDECVLSIADLDYVYCYDYPFAPLPTRFDLSSFGDSEIPFSASYVDPEGNSWGFVSYLYGIRNVWICQNHPTYDREELLSLNTTSFTIEVVHTSEENEKENVTIGDPTFTETAPEKTDTTTYSEENIPEENTSADPVEKAGDVISDVTAEAQAEHVTKTSPVLTAGIAVVGVMAVTALILILLKKKRC